MTAIRIDWQLGNHDSQTLGRLLKRLSQWRVTVYCTDDWKPYQHLLDKHPEAFHVISKKETTAIERNNSLCFIEGQRLSLSHYIWLT